MRCSAQLLRYRTAWRDLLHPLPIAARQSQWLKRDTVEMNEALLRQPYYTLKSYALPAFIDKAALFQQPALAARDASSDSVHNSSYGMNVTLKAPRHATSPEQLQRLRDLLQIPSAAGPAAPPLPLPHNATNDTSSSATHAQSPRPVRYEDEYGTRLRPRYPESWDTVPPHQPSRAM